MSSPGLERLVAVGNICTQWAYLEYLFSQSIWGLLGLDEETGKIVTGGLDIRGGMQMAIALSDELGAPAALKMALKQDRKLIEDSILPRRNQAVHGIGFSSIDDDGSDVWVEAHKSKKYRSRQPLTADSLSLLGKQIGDAATRLHLALEALRISGHNGNFLEQDVNDVVRQAAAKLGS